MNETSKTFAFLFAAIASVAGAYYIEHPNEKVDVDDYVGTLLNKNIDPAAPRRLKVVKFDAANSTTRQFEVAEVDGVWSIPSKENYPADATRQMAEAATCVIDRKVLRVAGQKGESHEQFGVVDPLAPGLNSKSKGVGTRVTMTDADDGTIVDMIIGSKVKDTTNQYYVRQANRDATYVVELEPEKLSTDFADWIEDDLLKLSAFDIRKVFINDYSAELKPVIDQGRLAIGVAWDQRGQFTLGYDDKDSKWTAVDLKKYDKTAKAWAEAPLADGEEVNQEKLNDLRTALDDLLIVDVARKPEGLSNDLKAGADFLNNREAQEDLVDKGFSPVGGENEILASEGEVLCTQRDGVEYVLRFGQLQLNSDGAADSGATADGAASKGAEGAAASAAAGADAKKPEDSSAANLRRYLFVMARFNRDVVEKPTLKDLPELPAGQDASASDAKSEEAKPGATSDEAKADEDKSNDAKSDDAKSDDEKKDENKKDVDAEREKIIAERKEIEAENQRLLDEYDETIKSGQKKVADLNARFGDWYYVISNDVYKKIHLNRADVVKKKDSPANAAGKPAADGSGTGLPSLPAATGGGTP